MVQNVHSLYNFFASLEVGKTLLKKKEKKKEEENPIPVPVTARLNKFT